MATQFHEVRFPTRISFGSSGGPMRKTDIVELASGYEERNSPWANSKRKYNVAYGIKSLNMMHELIAFWEARFGKLYGFRYKDWSDYKSCPPNNTVTATDQMIATGNAMETVFQLTKTYTSGDQSYVRQIRKPVNGTVVVAVGGTPMTYGWSVIYEEGLLIFNSPPAAGVPITVGYEFDVPVRFDSDELSIDLSEFRIGSVSSIPLVEIRV